MDIVGQIFDFIFSAVFFIIRIVLPYGILFFFAAIALLIWKFNRDFKAMMAAPDFRNMFAGKKDIPSSADVIESDRMERFRKSGEPPGGSDTLLEGEIQKDGPKPSIYFSRGDVYLPQGLVTAQYGHGMEKENVEYLRLPLRDATEISTMYIRAARGNISYITFKVPYLRWPLTIFTGKGLGEPPPPLFDADKFIHLARKETSAEYKELGAQPFYKVFNFL